MDDIAFDLADYDPPAIVIPAADPPAPKWELHEPKDNKVRNREIAFQVLNAIDAVQTAAWCEKWDKHVKCEMNPIFGDHPSTAKIIGIKALSGVLHYIVTDRLRDRKSKLLGPWQVSTIVIMGGTVVWNTTVIF